jgi:hypothetical protein
MVLYAASNVMAVNIPADVIGGGVQHSHSRPGHGGAPVHPWGLECLPCEDYLRVHNSDQWSATLTDIPATYDETRAREQAEKSGKLDRENQLAAAIIELGKLGQLPAALGQVLAPMLGAAGVPLAGMLECAACGGAQAPGMRFCGNCGQPMSHPAAAGALSAPERPAEPVPPEDRQRSVRLRDARLDELQALARLAGVDPEGKRPDLISRLGLAGVTNADLARLPVAA